MSASLVGSEMCIRDRRSGCATTRRGWGSGRPTLWSAPGPWASGSTPRTCLLYTSDAADDM
eukprot:1265467-Alexandrium_andersonii.AAC.1